MHMKLRGISIIVLILILSIGIFTNEKVDAAEKKKLNEINKVSVGTQHLFLLGRDGSIWSAGMNLPGLLGRSGNAFDGIGVISSASNVVDISAGGFRSLALTSDGTLLSWPGTTDVEIPDLITSVKNIKAIATGSNFSVLLTNDGGVWTWGSNSSGELGLGDTQSRTVPTQIPNFKSVVEIAASYSTTYALKSDGSVWGWGTNATDQLGNETMDYSLNPIEIKFATKVKHIYQKAGYGAAIDINGDVWSWGTNSFGQLGDGTQTKKITPSKIEGLQGIKELALGTSHVLALKEDGTVISWGANTRGKLGDGTTTNSLVPVNVKGLTNIVSISAGANTSAAISNSSKIYLWGMDVTSNGTTTSMPRRILVDDYSLEVPKGLKLKLTNPSSVHLKWASLTADDDSLDGFNIYHNGVLIGNTHEREYVINNLNPDQEHRFYITTRGLLGNESEQSSVVVKKKKQKYSFTYNSAGQLISIIYDSGKKIVYEYDKNGNLKKLNIINPLTP
ncbi:hypothetical protein PAEAM_39080 [Paenibacillus sp. GM1FR]|nr:hypothetical protein PAEAM_39080 [Paenibacillus sp. GM1FR]